MSAAQRTLPHLRHCLAFLVLSQCLAHPCNAHCPAAPTPSTPPLYGPLSPSLCAGLRVAWLKGLGVGVCPSRLQTASLVMSQWAASLAVRVA